jgi:transposase
LSEEERDMRTGQDLVPKGLRSEHLSIDRERVVISVASSAASASCPLCGRRSGRVHSRYLRKIADLPWHGTPVVLRTRVRRFFCDEGSCERRIFCERLPEVAAHARKTGRLDGALLLVAFELGGRAGARLASELGLLVSRDSLIRRLRRSPAPAAGEVKVLGVDDWAARKGERYGTVLVDLERRRVVDLLPDRSAEALAGWLEEHPGVEVVARDRYRPYAEGARAGAPGAVQVADRFHLLRNLYDAVEKLVERNRRGARPVAETPPARARPPDGPRGFGKRADLARREERLRRYERAVEMRERGMYVEDMAQEMGMSRSTVVAWLSPDGPTEHGRGGGGRPSPIAPYADYVERRLAERCINMAQIFRELQAMGYGGSYDAVAYHIRCLRRGLSPPAAKADGRPRGTRYDSQETARLLMLEAKDPAALDPEQGRYLKELRALNPELAAAQEMAGGFAEMVREGEQERFEEWLEEAARCDLPEMRAFASGVRQDEEAVRAAIREPWSNGQVEGHVNRLKMLKRQMFGRAKFDLLRRRVLGAA